MSNSKGAPSIAAVNPDHLANLQAGLASSRSLSELLAIDFAKLLEATDRKAAALAELDSKAGITTRMQQCAKALYAVYGNKTSSKFANHISDTVRGWAVYTLPYSQPNNIAALLKAVYSFADDAHFGVREWAWLAVRPQLASELSDSIRLLTKWTDDSSAYVRRFASEVLRPRGVWCTHIAELKQQPELALPILQPLQQDPARYVQDSVANWLNDASKDQPDWVRALCARWRKQSDSIVTAYICKRALRSIEPS